MKNINLIPKSYYTKQKLKKLMYKVVTVIVTTFLFKILFVAIISHTINSKRQKFDALNNIMQDTRLVESNAIAREIRYRQQEIEFSQNIITSLKSEVGAEISISIVMQNMLDEMELIEIFYDRQESRIVIITQATDKNVIPIFIDNLNNTNMFNHVNILTATNSGDMTIFSIQMFIVNN